MRFHLLGLAHIPTTSKMSACAYTNKIVRLGKMLKDNGHTVIFYGVDGSEVECDEYVVVLSEVARLACYGEYDMKKEFFKLDGCDAAYTEFNKNAIKEINDRKEKQDILLCSMGCWHKPIADGTGVLAVESGIGYEGIFSNFKVFESYAWMHWLYGKLGIMNGVFYDAVIPNYYDLESFPFQNKKQDYALFIGRLVRRKGLEVAVEVTKRLGMKLIVAGQGSLVNPKEGLNIKESHVEHIGCVNSEERAKLMGEAKLGFVPTYYIEPFGGVAVELQLCFPAETKVFAKNVERAYSHEYTGDLIEVSVGENKVECTPNHPFLTQRGWVAAENLNLGDWLISRVNYVESQMDSERIGDYVERVSQSWVRRDGEAVGASCFYRDFKSEAKEGQSESIYLERNGIYTRKLLQNGSERDCGVDAPFCGINNEESRLYGVENGEGLETDNNGRDGGFEVKLCTAWSGEAWEEVGIEPCNNKKQDAEVANKNPNIIGGNVLPCDDVTGRVVVLCGDNRRIGHDNNENTYEEQSQGSANFIGSKYCQNYDRLDNREVNNSECDSLLQRGGGRVGGEGYKINEDNSVGKGFKLFAFIQGSDSVSDSEALSDGNSGRMGGIKISTNEKRTVNRAYENVGKNDSLYEFKGIRSIRRRKVEKLPVFNLGTSSGIYEANGLVVHNCGTPVITTDFGVFSETVLHGKTGYRCRTIEEFVWSAKNIENIKPEDCRKWASENYSVERVSKMYEEYFRRISTLWGEGWYAENDGRTELDWLNRHYI